MPSVGGLILHRSCIWLFTPRCKTSCQILPLFLPYGSTADSPRLCSPHQHFLHQLPWSQLKHLGIRADFKQETTLILALAKCKSLESLRLIFVTLEPVSADFEDTPPLPVTVILPHLNQLEVLLKKPRPADIHVFNSIFTILHAPQLRLVVHDLGPQLEAEAATFLSTTSLSIIVLVSSHRCLSPQAS